MPIEKLGMTKIQLPLNLTHAERKARIKNMVIDELPSDGEALMHHSQEEYVYDDSGAWAVSEETVATDPDSGQAESHVVLDRRLGTLGSATFLFQDSLCKEAFEKHDDMACVPRQISAVLKRDFGEVCEDMSIIERALYGDERWPEKRVYAKYGSGICKDARSWCRCNTQRAGDRNNTGQETSACFCRARKPLLLLQ